MNPLFRRAMQAIRDAAARDKATRALMSTLGKVSGALTSKSTAKQAEKQILRQIKSLAGGLDVERYGKISNLVKDVVMRQIETRFGPLGSVIAALLRPSGKSIAKNIEDELQAAAGLLRTFGYTVSPPSVGASSPIPAANPLTPPSPPSQITVGNAPEVAPTGPRWNGQQFASDDPILTGEMIRVRSSNVHSIGYDWNWDNPQNGTLKVRFLAEGKPRTGPGPLYHYHDVPPDVFVAFQRAASKGQFVWDELRVRGTVSGHQYSYDLAGTGKNDYIPRQAGLKRGKQGEWYLTRTFQGRQSRLPEQPVRGGRGDLIDEFKQRAGKVTFSNGRPPGPNRGTPNRGR